MPEPGAGDTTSSQPPPGERNAPRPDPDITKDFYDILGVTKTASADEIKRIARQRVRELHPDIKPGDKEAQERLKAVTEAYDTLKDGAQRRRYDELREREAFFASRNGSPSDSGAEDFTSEGEPSGTDMGADSGQDARDGSSEPPPEPWWKNFGTYDEFDFPEERIDKTGTRGRSRTQRPRRAASREKEQAAQDRITEAAKRRRNRAQESALSNYKNGKWTYDQYFTEWMKAKHLFDRRFFQETKYGVMSAFGEANATVASRLEASIFDRLVHDKHYSVEPKIYSLPDGTYIRISWSDWNRDTPHEESRTRIEHITGARDEKGYFHSEGLEIVREGQKPGNTFWLRRITRPYNMNGMYLDMNQIFGSLQFYFDNGFGGPYRTISTKGKVKNGELREYMAMLQQATPREQPVGV